MEVSFNDLKYLVKVVADDLLRDDFGHLQVDSVDSVDDVSEEIYDKVHCLEGLLHELYKYRPLPF